MTSTSGFLDNELEKAHIPVSEPGNVEAPDPQSMIDLEVSEGGGGGGGEESMSEGGKETFYQSFSCWYFI